ncbi:hypothetical protein DL93DRAFT_389019 [Clavulina sp. PMI_390]|nr:hypothetical protein DL93DRAFT_389019 [Clavulina sp. PMI_390]
MLEIFQLTWDDQTPSFARVASRRSRWEEDSPVQSWLEGDHVCVCCDDGILLWNWRKDTCGLVQTVDWHNEGRFLIQPPYVLSHIGPDPKLFILGLERMQKLPFFVAPILSHSSCHLHVINNWAGEEAVRPGSFGTHRAVSSAAESRKAIIANDILLFGDEWSYEEAPPELLQLYTWSPATRTFKILPPIPPFCSSSDHIRLPSGNLLFKPDFTGAGPELPILSEGTQYPGVTCVSFYVHKRAPGLRNYHLFHSTRELYKGFTT